MVYASRRIDGGSEVLMHRQILGLTKGDGKIADHINGNGLDNRRANLRVTDRLGNAPNAIGRRNTAVPFKGCDRRKTRGCFRSRIKVCKKEVALGSYKTPVEAHLAYCYAAAHYHGEFARTA